MQAISPREARGRHWDVVVAGSSFAAMFFARALPPGLSILIVEKGGRVPHPDLIAAGKFPAETFRQSNTSGHPKDWVANTLFGGNSNCWWACTPRFHPSDFRLRSLYGVGEDWPLSYDDLEQAYCDAEEIMEIAGGGSDHVLPRSRPFPYPPHAPSRTDTVLQAGSEMWWPQPTARSNGGRRAPCCANGICNLCPIDAKFTIQNAEDSFARDGAFLLTGTEMRALRIEAGTARAALLRLPDGTEAEVAGDLFALGANGIFNAAILMRSGLTSHALGRYLHEQVSRPVGIDIDHRNFFGGTSITGHGYHFYDGPHRSAHAAVLLENWNAPPSLRTERGRWTERLTIKLIAEDLPRAENRVTLGAGDEPAIEWHGHHDYALRGLDRAVEALPGLLPFGIERVEHGPLSATEAHIQGTHRMGTDPATSVTGPDLRCHEAPNVLALGAGAWPSCAPANPSLTIAALSLHSARTLF